jgi:hypothetical protein
VHAVYSIFVTPWHNRARWRVIASAESLSRITGLGRFARGVAAASGVGGHAMGAVCRTFMSCLGLAALLRLIGPATAADLQETLPVKAPPISAAYDWTGFYVGGYLGYAGGNSNWATAPDISGSLNLTQRLDSFNETGSWFAGLRFGRPHVVEPHRPRGGSRRDVSKLSKSRRSLHRRHIEPQLADQRAGKLQRDDALFRHRARSHRLRAGELAFLWDWRVCLDLRSADADATGHWHDRHACGVLVGRLGPASRSRSRRTGRQVSNTC